MIKQVADNIYTIQIPLPNNPLKWLNSYVIAGNGLSRNLIVDTGFNMPECYEALNAGIQELGLKYEETDCFLTHLHSDHTGNADKLFTRGTRMIMGRSDYIRLRKLVYCKMSENRSRVAKEGMSEAELSIIFNHNPAVLYAPGYFDAQLKDDGDSLSYGGYNFSCLLTPGHTPGHMCLYDEKKSLILLGDHVLYDITPNITFWSGVSNSLKDYLSSLTRVKHLYANIALPAHRNCMDISLYDRVVQLQEHHAVRLAELKDCIKTQPGLSANELAERMSWHVKSKSWDDFPPAQKWFAVGEAIAHIDFLVCNGEVDRDFIRNRDCWVYE